MARAARAQVWGYVPNYDRAAAWATVREHRKLLTGVSFFQYQLAPDGGLLEYPGMDREPAWTREEYLPTVPMVTNLVGERWDRDLVVSVIGDPARRRHHVEQVLALTASGPYPAVELDYESLSAEDRPVLSDFVEEIARALHEGDKQLSLAVHGKLSEPGEGIGAAAQDWRALGAAADRIVVMTYDHDPSRPGPIAPIQWTHDVLRFALSQMPRHKVIQGIPFYGYDWTTGGPIEYWTYRETMDLAALHGARPVRDETDRHLVVEYNGGGANHVIWIPDGETVGTLMAVGRELGVAGYAIWRMGGEDPLAWETIRKVVGSTLRS